MLAQPVFMEGPLEEEKTETTANFSSLQVTSIYMREETKWKWEIEEEYKEPTPTLEKESLSVATEESNGMHSRMGDCSVTEVFH